MIIYLFFLPITGRVEAVRSESDHPDVSGDGDQDDHDETVTKRISIPMTLPLPRPRTGGFIQIFTHNPLPHNFIRIPTHNSPLSHTLLTWQIIIEFQKQIISNHTKIDLRR